jgi:formate-dependent nitrite reductase membrane component NrfD
MYSLFIVWYIFLAGMGSGAYAIASLFRFVGRFSGKEHIQEYRHIAEGGFLIGPILVIIGSVFLLFDLGAPEKAFMALLSTNMSVLSIGVWHIVLFCPLSVALLFIRVRTTSRASILISRVLQVFAFLLALGLMAYTGVFLACMKSVPFHYNWLLVALFIISSLSTGAAVIALYGFLNQHKKAMLYSLNLIPGIDLALLVLEILALGAFIGTSYFGGDASRYSLNLLLQGDMAPYFWVGTVLVGLALPLTLTIIGLKEPMVNLIAGGSISTIVGGFFLRYCIISVAIHVFDYVLL